MSLTRKNSNDVAKENGKGILIQYGTIFDPLLSSNA